MQLAQSTMALEQQYKEQCGCLFSVGAWFYLVRVVRIVIKIQLLIHLKQTLTPRSLAVWPSMIEARSFVGTGHGFSVHCIRWCFSFKILHPGQGELPKVTSP